jgi:4-diphosphocytidyl-2-C-methyl-D-erythritol kinase
VADVKGRLLVVALSIDAPAKINLHLQVVGRRPDWFHELRTLLQCIDLADRLEATALPSGQLELSVEPRGAAPEDDGNLVLRAARALQQQLGASPGARLRLHKQIPAGAGLGGGSSDAAAALVLLDQLWSAGLPPSTLHLLAAELGSDVPFFLYGGLALGVGRGEEIYPLADLPSLGVVVVMPEIEIETAEVYRRLPEELTWRRPESSVYSFSAGLDTDLYWGGVRNDLQAIVTAGWPEVADALESLQSLSPVHAAVTGSGAAVFALFPEPDQARQAAAELQQPGRVHVGTTLSRALSRPIVQTGSVAVTTGKPT